MNHRAFTLGLVCLATLASLAPAGASAQGLRASDAASGTGGTGLSSRALPPVTVPDARTGADRSGIRQADYIVAVVNTAPITNNEVQTRVARVEQQLAAQGGERPPRDVVAREVLERVINEKIQVQMANESGIKVDDIAVSQAEQSVARQNNVSLEEMHRRLAIDGISKDRFREELRNQLLVQRLRERDVEARVRVSDLDVDQYLREQQSASDPAKVELNLGHILVLVPENASPEVVEQRRLRAQQAADKVRAGDDFGQVAREFSDAAEGASGGLLGLRPADRYPELFVRSTQQTPVGGIVGPVRSPAGFHVLKVVEKTNAAAPTVAVQSHARHILLRANPQLTETAAAARLADYRRRILAGQADFATLARENSQDGSSKQGGDLGWASPGRYVPEFEEALNALKPGEISEPIVTRFGVHLIQLLERREAKLTQREQRDMVRDVVREKKLDEAYATWAQEARARAYVEYRDPPQ
ncbi:peptidylprolyl isomerase [Acidovorax sp. SUPP3434]|uniref:peptidylprolyl isomerase n=1 Tax=Acidovorax sp. SUPP3434 TaxID=2920880 RepID=UPI0023DE437B|nr:peptidylprolyl isomerase [Acidovorax sp. SUPP3434]GKT01543.1 peptidylprolyl isomerase [Acidovorax sp. SUPP3434]